MDRVSDCLKRSCSPVMSEESVAPASKKRRLEEEKDNRTLSSVSTDGQLLSSSEAEVAVLSNDHESELGSVVAAVAAGIIDESEEETPVSAETTITTTGILSLSDDVLLILLSYLNSTDLFNLSRCNVRLFNICGDKSLWNKVDAVCDGCTPPLHNEQASYFQGSTFRLQFVKVDRKFHDEREDSCFGGGDKFFRNLSNRVPNLCTLIIENHVLSANNFMLKYLPESLTELRLPNSNLLHLNQDTFFHNMSTLLPNLEIFDASYCQWFSAYAFLPLGKCSKLKELKITGCRQLKDFIPYASIATAFGFKELQKLDMRLTDIVDREIACFNKTKSLKHIYLEKPEEAAAAVVAAAAAVVAQNANDDESVTDICTTSFGMRNCQTDQSRNTVLITRVPIEGGPYMDYTLETLVVRNYPGITDITLKHAQKCLKSLKYLDVTGCSCTAAQATIFKLNRPEVTLIFNGIRM